MKYSCYMRSHLLLFALLSGTIVSILSLGLENNTNYHNLQFSQIVYGHNFTPNESASFLAFVEQLQTESELVQTNLANNNISLAQLHANNAAVLLTPSITSEIAEQNQRVADDLTTAINDLQDITSSSSTSLQQQNQSIDQIVSNIDAILGEAVTTRIEQEQRNNATIQALAFADLVDSILVNYGNAYSVKFDMTNMSNMIMTGSNNDSSMTMDNIIASQGNNNSMNMETHSMGMEHMDNSSTTEDGSGSEMNRNYSLVNMSNYQSAHALSNKTLEIYNTELRPIISGSAFATNLENALVQLNDAVRNKSSPMDIMMIVHIQVHPNLLQAFGLESQ
jgi:hypothetical protein